jgi:gamma-glutamylputrescine oxidase
MTVSTWQANGTQPIREVDFLIIGGGLFGGAAANFAAQAGRHVTITDSGDVALGASSRNAGFMITGLDTYYHHAIAKYGHAVTREMWALSVRSHGYWREWAKRGGVPLTECGSLLLAESEDEKRDLEQAIVALNADGIEAVYHSTDPLGRGYSAAIEQPWDAAVQPYLLARSVIAHSGAEVITNNEVYAISQDDEHTVTVKSRQYIFRARDVLICTNAYAARLDPYFVGKVIPTRGQVLVTAPLKNTPVIGKCGYSDYGYMYYRDTFDGRLLIGGGRKQNKPLENDTTEDRINDPVQRVLEDYLRQWFPDAAEAGVEQRWAGIMGFTPDGLPLVGTLPGKPGVGFAVGCNGHGLSLGAGIAERAVAMMINGTHPGALDAARLQIHA